MHNGLKKSITTLIQNSFYMNDTKKTDPLLSIADFTRLANTHDQHCISIYIPTSRTGEMVDKKLGQLTLKNKLKELKIDLKDYQLKDHEIDNLLYPATELINDQHFWRNQSDCLVIFITQEGMQYFAFPIDQEAFTYVADHFYLLPLLPLLNNDGKFFILALSLNQVTFYEATPFSITKVYVEDLIPEKLEEAVGYDIAQKGIQFRTGNANNKSAIFHGQGSGKDDKNMEIEKFLRAVDKGLMKLIKNESAPLILACVDHYFPIYNNISNYAFIFDQHIGGNHDTTDPYILHEMAWSLIELFFLEKRNEKKTILQNQAPSGKTSFDLNDIIPASIEGKIDTLFLKKYNDRYGIYDQVNRSLIIDEEQKLGQASLYNLAAVQTLLKGGTAYLSETMPVKGTNINALYRY